MATGSTQVLMVLIDIYQVGHQKNHKLLSRLCKLLNKISPIRNSYKRLS